MNLECRPDFVMFDSMIFDKLLIQENLARLPKDIKYIATSIQYKQIQSIPKEKSERRNALLNFFHDIVEIIETIDKEWLMFRNANFCNLRFCSPLEEATLRYFSGENGRHIEDALILLTAHSKNLILVSNDKDNPFTKAKNLGYAILNFQEFLETYSK